MHFSIIFERLVSMRTIFGYEQHSAVLRAQFNAVPFAVRWRLRSEIKNHVKHRTSGTADQLRLNCWRKLQMHPPHGSPCLAEAHVRLDRQEIETVLGELPRTPRSQESPAVVLVRASIDHLGTRNACINKAHSTTILYV